MAGTKTAKTPKASKAEAYSKVIDETTPDKAPRKPRAPSAYNLYVKQFYIDYKANEDNEKMPPKQMIAAAATSWKNLTDEEKAEFKASHISTSPTTDDEATESKEDKPKKEEKPKKATKSMKKTTEPEKVAESDEEEAKTEAEDEPKSEAEEEPKLKKDKKKGKK